jgi:hypothetical protein
MIITLIVLIVITVVAVIYFSSYQEKYDGTKDDDYKPMEKPTIIYEKEDMSQSYQGTLEDRNIAALQYEKMKNSLSKHGMENMDNQMTETFHKMALKLSTIGTKATPQEVEETLKENKEKGLPGGWSLEK